MKKLVVSVLSAVVMLNTIAFAAFDDIKNHWAAEYINSLSEKGIINGVSKNIFAPNGTVTRAEYLKIMMNVTGIAAVTARKGECLDAKTTDWYAPYLQGALDKGLIPKEMIASYEIEIIDNGEDIAIKGVRSGYYEFYFEPIN